MAKKKFPIPGVPILQHAINEFPLLTRYDEVRLGKILKESQDKEEKQKAVEVFILSNIRLVVSIAARYTKDQELFTDLFQVGVLGLMRAVEDYDYHRENRFSTYAAWWIRQYIVRELERSNLVYVPRYMKNLEKNYKKETEEAKSKNQILSKIELAKKLGTNVSKLEAIKFSAHIALSACRMISSIDSSPAILNHIECSGASPGEHEFRIFASDRIKEALWQLTPRQREVIELRFGLRGEPMTLNEIGAQLKITREAVRNSQNKALKILSEDKGLMEIFELEMV